jgi:hypothetical protein
MPETDTIGKILIALAGAVFGFISSVALDMIRRRREPRRRLTYSLASTPIALDIGDEAVSQKLELRYGNRSVKALHVVTCRLRNSGNQLIKNQYLRFEFPNNLIVRDCGFTGSPEPELQVVARADSPAWKQSGETDRVQFKIGHMEPRAEVGMFVVVEGESFTRPLVKGHNEDGTPEVVETAAEEILNERERLASLLRTVALLGATGMLMEILDIAPFHASAVIWAAALFLFGRNAPLIVSALLGGKGPQERSAKVEVGAMSIREGALSIVAYDSIVHSVSTAKPSDDDDPGPGLGIRRLPAANQ